MKYISTRNNSKEYSFEEVFIKGLADDGGLFIPKSLKKYSEEELKTLSTLNYQDLAKKIIFPFIGDFMTANEVGAPENPKILKKSFYSIGITTIIFTIICLLMKYEYLDLTDIIS